MAGCVSALRTHGAVYRAVAWCYFGMVVVLGLCFAVFGSGDLRSTTASDILTYELPMLIAVALCGALAFRGPRGFERRFWGLLAVALGFILVAETYWTWYSLAVDSSGPSLEGPVIIVYFSGMLVGARLLYEMSGVGAGHLSERARFVLDVAAAAAAAFGLAYSLWTWPLLGDVEAGGWQMAAIAAVYPVLATLMAAAAASVLAGWSTRQWKNWERMIATALATVAAALATYPFWLFIDLTDIGPGLSRYVSVLGAAIALVAVAAVYRLSDFEGEALTEPWPIAWSPQSTAFSSLFPVLLVMALPILGFMAFEAGRADGIAPGYGAPVAVAAVVLAVLLAARSVVVSVEQASNLQKVFTDPATGALNRNWLDSILRRKLVDISGSEAVMSLVVFDIADEDRFNAVIGHSAGAAVLSRVASVLAEETPAPGEVFSLSEYEFAVMLPEMSASDAAVFARRTWLRLSREATVEGRPLDIAAGVAMFPDHAADAQALVVAAESALGTSRGSETEPVVVFGDTEHFGDTDESVTKTRMRALRSTIRALAEAVDARDPHTVEHSTKVSELCTALAQVMDMPEHDIQVIGLAALVHDVGKVGVHDEVLLKGGELTTDERHEMELHTLLGERILAPTRIDEVLPIVRSHHEHWDGSGYPDGLVGRDIPLGARILAVCDAYDAITAGRSYKRARSAEEALVELHAYAGTHFDPELAATFSRFVRRLDATRAAQPVTLGRVELDGMPT